MMTTRILSALALALLVGLARRARAEDLGSPTVCTPGQQIQCACPGSASGAQRCNAEGSAFDACVCNAIASPSERPRKKNRGVGLIVGGTVLTGVIYLATASAIGIALGVDDLYNGESPRCTGSLPWGFLPLAGPFITAGEYPNFRKRNADGRSNDCTDYTGVVRGIAVVDGLVQLAGASMIAAGVALRSTGPGDDTSSLSFGISPVGGGGVFQLTWRGR